MEYYRSLSAHVSDGLTYFNQLISWGNSLILANVLAVAVTVLLGKEVVPYQILSYLGLFMLFLLHYLVLRSARGYVNLIRFTSIQKDVTEWILNGTPESDLMRIAGNIRTFHVQWVSPLSKSTILSKVWLSSGFVFHAAVLCVLIAYCLKHCATDFGLKAAFAGFFVANLILFVTYFSHCRYFKKCIPYPIAHDQA